MAVSRVVSPVRMMVIGAQLNNEEIIINSPSKLIDGGRARFMRLASNHHSVIRGSVAWSP